LKNARHPICTPAAKALWEFVDVANGGSECSGDHLTYWTEIFDYAILSAKHDKRVPKDHEFGPFSLIRSIKKVPGQIPHLDVMFPNFLFTMMVTDNTPGTLVFSSKEPQQVFDVPSFVEWIGAKPDSQIKFLLENNKEMTEIVETYGVVLDGLTKGKLQTVPLQREKLSSGALMSIPGSLIHAGPSFTKFRVMLFLFLMQRIKKKKPKRWTNNFLMDWCY
jgi:hypothetical protein